MSFKQTYNKLTVLPSQPAWKFPLQRKLGVGGNVLKCAYRAEVEFPVAGMSAGTQRRGETAEYDGEQVKLLV